MTFETFWQQYSRKVGKHNARKAYEKVLKMTDYATIIAVATQYQN